MNNGIKHFFGFILIFSFVTFVTAQKETGGSKLGSVGFKFLNIGVDAQEVALGGNAAMAGNASAVFINPAGLAKVGGVNLSVGIFGWLVDSKVMHASVASPMLGGTVSAFYYSLDYGDFNRVNWSSNSDGTFNFDPNKGTFTAFDMVLGIGYARKLSDKFSLGGAAKMVSEKIDSYSVNAFAYDVGVQFATGYKNIHMGAVISNFGPDAQDKDNNFEEFSLPMNFDFGIAGQLWGDKTMGLVGVLNMEKNSDLASQFSVGGEMTVVGIAKIRGSYNLSEDHPSPLSFGAGINKMGISVDLTYTTTDDFDSIVRISIGYAL